MAAKSRSPAGGDAASPRSRAGVTFKKALHAPDMYCRPDLPVVTLAALQSHGLSLIAAAWRRQETQTGPVFGLSGLLERGKAVAVEAANGSLLQRVGPSPVIALIIPLRGSGTRTGAIDLATKLQKLQHQTPVGTIAIADDSLFSWRDTRGLIESSLKTREVVVPPSVDYVGIPAGDFCNHVYETCVRLSCLTKM